MSVSKCDQEAYGCEADILDTVPVEQEEMWENWAPDATTELQNSHDTSLGQSNTLDLPIPMSPFEIEGSPLWHDERPLLNTQGRPETSWSEEPIGIGIEIGEDQDSQFEKRTFDFIAGDVLSGLHAGLAGLAEGGSDPLHQKQVPEKLSTTIIEQLSQVQVESVPSPSIVRHRDSPNPSRAKRMSDGPRLQASDAAHIAALESDAAKLAEKNRKSRERSLRTRTRNAEKMNEVEKGVRRLKAENAGIKSILDGSQSDLESLLLAVLPTCVQQFENELARTDSPGVRRCATYLVATVQRLLQNKDRASSYANLPQEKICSRPTGDVATLQSKNAISKPNASGHGPAHRLAGPGFSGQGHGYTSSNIAAEVLHSEKLLRHPGSLSAEGP